MKKEEEIYFVFLATAGAFRICASQLRWLADQMQQYADWFESLARERLLGESEK